MKISIIGTCGRRDDGPKMTRALYMKMVADARQQIVIIRERLVLTPSYQSSEDNKISDTHLISGGAGWSDHCAISLYLMDLADSLTLYFPCKWTGSNQSVKGKISQTERTMRYYHALFSKKMGGNTLAGIQKAIDKGAVYHEIEGGFLARNLLVGRTDAVLAYTWGEGDMPKDGGTAHTWSHSDAPIKIHRPLSLLV